MTGAIGPSLPCPTPRCPQAHTRPPPTPTRAPLLKPGVVVERAIVDGGDEAKERVAVPLLEHITIFSLSFAPDGAIDPLLDAWAGGAMIMLDRVELRQSVHTTRGLQALEDAIQKGALPAVTQLSLPQNELSSLSVEPLLRISSHLNQLKHLELHDNAQLWVDAGAFSLPEQPALQELRATLDGRGIQLHLRPRNVSISTAPAVLG